MKWTEDAIVPDSVALFSLDAPAMNIRGKIPKCLLWVCVVFMSLSCRQQAVNDVNASKGRSANEWWVQPGPNDIDWASRPLDRSQWELVSASNELEAEVLLRTTAAVLLSDDQIAKLGPAKHPRGLPFLVRAIGSTWGTSGLNLYTNNRGELWVAGGALSHRTVPIERRAIVVWLERRPARVYVTFGMAE